MYFVKNCIGLQGDGCSFVIIDFNTSTHTDNTTSYTSPGSVCPYHGMLPTVEPTPVPTDPTIVPTGIPTATPTDVPSSAPTTAPSPEPTTAPSSAPTTAPSSAPTTTPSSAPTNFYCDETVQTNETFIICAFLEYFDDMLDIFDKEMNVNLLHEKNYCDLQEYFNCSKNSQVVTGIFLNDTNITGELTADMIDAFPNSVQVLDLSGNNIYGSVGDWSGFSHLRVLNLAHNSLRGSVEFDQLCGESSESESNLLEINLAHNEWSGQTIDWRVFQYAQNLEKLDLSNNKFGGTIEFQDVSKLILLNLAYNSFDSIYGFDEIKNVENLKELRINNNNIEEQVDLSWLPGNLEIFYCSNNSLFGDLNMNDIPTSLVEFDCGSNDFGILEWEVSDNSYSQHDLQYLKMDHANLKGNFKIQVFDNEGTFNRLKYLDLSYNSELNITLFFEYLSGIEMEYLNILGITHAGKADFTYLTDSIVIKMSTSVVCSNNFCNGKSRNVPWTRTNNTCVGKEDCLDTCTCVTEYDAGIYEYNASSFGDTLFSILIFVIIVAIGCGFAGLGYNKNVCGRKQIWKCKKRDDFSLMFLFGYVFQLWDFFSDILLCYDIYDRWFQEPVNSDDKHPYMVFLSFSFCFIFIPWFVNLLFLVKVKNDLYKDGDVKDANKDVNIKNKKNKQKKENKTNPTKRKFLVFGDSLTQSKYKTAKWLNKNGKVLVILCMLSGGLTASLRLVNSKLFGLTVFDMGLPKYKQDETVRHRLWLTVILENIPQILISTFYARTLSSFNQTVMLALISSIASVILAIFSAILEFPKNYYIYQMTCLMTNNSVNGKVRKQLRKINSLTSIICESFDQDHGFLFIENVFYDGKNKFIANVVCNEEIDFKINNKQKQNMKSNLLSKFKIEISSFEFKYICHECVDFVSFRELCLGFLFYVCCPCLPCLPCNQKIRAWQSRHRLSAKKTAPNAATNNAVDREMMNVMSNSVTKGDDDDEIEGIATSAANENWAEWTCEEVSSWIEAILVTNEFNENKIEDFMNEFNLHFVNGKLLKQFHNNESVLSDFHDSLKSQSVIPFSFWMAIKYEIENLQANDNDHDCILVADEMECKSLDAYDKDVDETTARLLLNGAEQQ